MKKWSLRLIAAVLGVVLSAGEPASAAVSCVDIFNPGPTDFDRLWLQDVEDKYQKGRNHSYSTTSFFNGTQIPYRPWAYRLGERYASGEDHAVLAHRHLGYELSTDQFGASVMRPPETLELFIKNFEKWKKEIQIKPEDNLELVFIFFKSSRNSLPPKFEDYVIIKASDALKPGTWPDPDLFTNVSDAGINSQLPPKVFVELLKRGLFQFPAGPFMDHEIGHLTELISQSAPGRDSLLSQIRNYSYQQSQKKKMDEKKKFRESLLLEFFALPELAKSDQINRLALRYGLSSGVSLKNLNEIILKKLSGLRHDVMLSTIQDFAKEVSPLIYRQGGASRDSHNFYENLKRVNKHEVFLEENGIHVPPDLDEKPTSPQRVSNDSLIAYLRDLENGFPELEDSRELESTLFHMEKNWSPNIKVTPEQYREMAINFMAARMSRILMALTTGLHLDLTPAQTIRDGLAERFNPMSALGQYLDSFLPEDCPTRRAFNLTKKDQYPQP